ncbi:MAG TPA: GGDEF domain-containing protein [Polyangia bacterium]|nr:GGDEF domain-containing protein [Polyangia bacterium]
MQLGLRQKLENCKSLPSLPAVAVHVLRLCQRENFDIADVARAIGSDAPLSHKVVSLVNSPLFGLRREVTTVSHALVLLGANAVRTIALSFAVVSNLREHERAGFDNKPYWRRAIFAASAAQQLAHHQGLRQPADAFLAALLQDLGELALQQAAPDAYLPLVTEAAGDHEKLVALENKAFGCDHAEIGRWLMTQWRLPEIVRSAVGSSHEPSRWQKGADPVTESVVKVVALSGALADIWVMSDVRRAAFHARERAQEILGMDEARMGAILHRVNATVVEVAPLFGLPVGTTEELEEVVTRVERIFASQDVELNDVLSIRSAGASLEAPEAKPALTDGLTGLASRWRFDTYLAEQFELAKKIGKPLSVLLCDPDHFDMINQTFGREAGDRALHAVGVLLGERLRYRDLAARYGGEEFALILTDTHAAGAAVVADRLRKKIEDAQHDIGIGDPVRMTMSVGIATLDEALTFATPADLLAAVERTLIDAKRAGRNRVATFASTETVAA